jgi:phosphatidylglycerol---prolipoprotein diacylglyceryl transferase
MSAGTKTLWVILATLGGAAVAGIIAGSQSWGAGSIPVQGYGAMILVGFVVGVWIAWRRTPLINVEQHHAVDIGVYGVLVGLAGARILHIIMYWPSFNPFENGFQTSRIASMFKLWEGGLVFYGAFLAVLPWCFWYCKRNGIPGIPFLDLAVPSVMAGQAFGRIGCFLNGCCYGKECALPWAVQFPENSPAYTFQRFTGLIDDSALRSVPIHPTQIYASVAAGLAAAFLYAYWPRRRYDGQILALTLIMAGTARFFEELLRADEPAATSAVPWLTLPHWIAIGIAAAGFALLLYFRKRNTLYSPHAA